MELNIPLIFKDVAPKYYQSYQDKELIMCGISGKVDGLSLEHSEQVVKLKLFHYSTFLDQELTQCSDFK